MSTGAGSAARTLFSDSDETVFNIKRPVMINGINSLVTNQDLVDRVLSLELPEIESTRARAEQETEKNARYTWVGNLTPGDARRLIARSRILVLSSRMEGGANVIAAAVIDRTPVLASRVSGNVGMLGCDYPGYFELGNTAALIELLQKCERDPSFLQTLQVCCDKRRHHFMESSEREGLAKLMGSLFSRSRG